MSLDDAEAVTRTPTAYDKDMHYGRCPNWIVYHLRPSEQPAWKMMRKWAACGYTISF